MADICVKFEGTTFLPPPNGSTLTTVPEAPASGTPEARLFQAVRSLLMERYNYQVLAGIGEPGKLSITIDDADREAAKFNTPSDAQKVAMVTVLGVLKGAGVHDPGMGANAQPGEGSYVSANGSVRASRFFVEAVSRAVFEFNTSPEHFKRVFSYLHRVGQTTHPTNAGGSELVSVIHPWQLAEVGRRLVDDGRDPRDAQFDTHIANALATVLGGGVDRRAVALEIKLPSLEGEVAGDVIQDNVAATAAVYFTAMLEDLKLFAVADKVAQEFVDGRIPVSKSRGGQAIFDYFKGSVNRLTENDRRGLYARVFGIAQGNVEVQTPNREFGDLWIRFLSSVSQLRRQTEYIQVTRVNEQQVFKAARDLAVNLSFHGYGMVHFAAVEFQDHVSNVKAMLSFPDVVAAYGARDIWQLVERVSDMHLGGTANGVRQRTLARTGADIILWLSTRTGKLSSNQFQNFIIPAQPANHPVGRPPILAPEEQRLVENIESWLAITGTRDETVEQYSAPVEMRQQSTIPQLFSMPSMQGVQDALKNSMQQLGGMNGGRLPQA